MDYDLLSVRTERGVAFVTIDNPPVNLLDDALARELDRLLAGLHDDDDVRVVVFESANPDFFLAHGDMNLVVDPSAFAAFVAGPGPLLQQRLRDLPQVTIGKVRGRARGGGNEFLLALDMRFAAAGQSWFGQPEVSLGILPGGGGTQRLPRLIGRARALEVILGSDLHDAETAEKYGWINRALPPADLDAYVERLATRIASYPGEAVAAARRAVDAAVPPVDEGLAIEGELLMPLFTSPVAVERFTAALEAGAHTPAGELDLEALLARAL